MRPKKYIKKLNNFKKTIGSPFIQQPMVRPRHILDLGPYGEYFVDSEIPRITNSNFVSDYFGEVGRIFNPIQINPIRVIIRDVIRSGDLNSWANQQYNNYGRKINATLMSLDPLGDVISQWHLIDCCLLDFEVNYDSFYEFTIVMDHFVSHF